VVVFFVGGLIMAHFIFPLILERVLKYLLVGFVFESYWQNRKQFGIEFDEMFQFQSFHMYGIIMVAIGTGWLEPDYKKKK
jgi:hypothetical protein